MPDNTAPPVLMLVGAHHDDNELMAGTIALHVEAGWVVVSVVVTDGRWTTRGTDKANSVIRQAESQAAASLLGTTMVCLDIPEGSLCIDATTRRLLIEQIRRFRPHVVICHPPVDYHFDHVVVSQLVTDAVSMAWNPTIHAAGEPWDVDYLYYCDAWFMDFTPDLYVDVSNMIDLKERAIGCHRSQLGETFPIEGDIIELERTRSRYRGIEAGCRYAESFRLVQRPNHRRMGASLLTQLLEDR